jgi:large subunit ribosomal protein L20
MPRVKRAKMHIKKRRNLFEIVKGFRYGLRNKTRLAKPASLNAGTYAYRDRRAKKRTFRNLWNLKINAGARLNGTTYSRLIDGMKKAGIILDRKILAQIAEHKPAVFTKIVEATKK